MCWTAGVKVGGHQASRRKPLQRVGRPRPAGGWISQGRTPGATVGAVSSRQPRSHGQQGMQRH